MYKLGRQQDTQMEIIEIKQKGWDHELLRIDITAGNICNYKCWYCWPECHSGDIKWPDFDVYTENISFLLDYYIANSPKRKFDFHIMGGEVTHWKRFPDFIKYFKDRYDCVFTLTTNASKSLDWWEKNHSYLDYVAISVHHQFSNPDHIKEVADFLYEKNIYVVALVLMDPFAWDKCMDIVKVLKSSKHRWTIRYNEIIDMKVAYDDKQNKILKKQRARFTNPWYFFKTNKSYRSKVKVVDNKNKIHSFKDNELILKRLNNFKDWECNVGVDWISIKSNGQISGICGNGLYEEGKVYNICDTNFKSQFSPKITPTICRQECCWCLFETNMSKRKL